MEPNHPPPLAFDLSWRMRDHEARLLVDALRSERLTLLFANAGPSRSALLTEGVLPLLARREADLPQAGFLDARVVAPFIDRRGPGGTADPDRARSEWVVYFSDWGLDPLPALMAEIRAAAPREPIGAQEDDRLADLLEAICDRLDARLLIVLDAFEQFWTDRSDSAEADRFVAALGEAIARPQLRANVLLAVDDQLEKQLQRLREAIPGFDDSVVRLVGFERDLAPVPKPQRRAPPRPDPALPAVALQPPPPVPPMPPVPLPPTLTDSVPPHALVPPPQAVVPPPKPRPKRRPKVPLPPAAPIAVDGVYDFIRSTLQKTADVAEPWQGAGAAPVQETTALDSGFEATRPEYPPEVQYPGLGRGALPVVPSTAPRAAEPWYRRLFRRSR